MLAALQLLSLASSRSLLNFRKPSPVSRSLVLGHFEGYGLQPVHYQSKMIWGFSPRGKYPSKRPPSSSHFAAQVSRPETDPTPNRRRIDRIPAPNSGLCESR